MISLWNDRGFERMPELIKRSCLLLACVSGGPAMATTATHTVTFDAAWSDDAKSGNFTLANPLAADRVPLRMQLFSNRQTR